MRLCDTLSFSGRGKGEGLESSTPCFPHQQSRNSRFSPEIPPIPGMWFVNCDRILPLVIFRERESSGQIPACFLLPVFSCSFLFWSQPFWVSSARGLKFPGPIQHVDPACLQQFICFLMQRFGARYTLLDRFGPHLADDFANLDRQALVHFFQLPPARTHRPGHNAGPTSFAADSTARGETFSQRLFTSPPISCAGRRRTGPGEYMHSGMRGGPHVGAFRRRS